jgi:acetamidase/formamidase
MNIKPSTSEAQRRLRLDDDIDVTIDLESAIEQAYSRTLQVINRTALHPDAAALLAAMVADPLHNGIVSTPDIISMQLMLIDALVGANSMADRVEKVKRAEEALQTYRPLGCF